MKLQVYPSPRAWKRHTGRAHIVGLSAGALACLGAEPKALEDPASFTGYVGAVRVLTRDDVMHAGQLAAAAIGTGRGVRAKRDAQGSMYTLFVPISHQAARELARPTQVPDIPSPGHGVRTAAYDAIMRPTARARMWAQEIIAEGKTP
jgi:hypothetical protein